MRLKTSCADALAGEPDFAAIFSRRHLDRKARRRLDSLCKAQFSKVLSFSEAEESCPAFNDFNERNFETASLLSGELEALWICR